MKKISQLLFVGTLLLAFSSCGDSDQQAENEGGNESSTETSTEASNNQSESTAAETGNETPADDYHISLNINGEEVSTGPTTGKVMIADDYICTVGSWKMKILSDGEYSAEKLKGNEYHAHMFSDEFASMNCKCQINELTGTGEKSTVGERIKADGTITCDDGAVEGTFKVQLFEPQL